MQVYGDIERLEDAAALVAEIQKRLDLCRALAPGLQQHQALVSAFIRASQLVQAQADADFAARGADHLSPNQQAGMALLLTLAHGIEKSWSGALAAPASTLNLAIAQLDALETNGKLTTRQAEGYAFYALYPEAYIVAAQQSGLGPGTIVIGIRSIGAGLAALVASALGTTWVYTVRPVGHPFDRQLALSEELARRLLSDSGKYAIVDEGPGLSGSSFNCVADWLVQHGVPEGRIHFFPSHTSDLGSAARNDHRMRWANASKHHASFEHTILHAANPAHRLENWIGAAVGKLTEPLRDMSGGNWRDQGDLQLADVPADPVLEKRKFLAMGGEGRWLAKFAGIGPIGEAKLQLAQSLAAAGFAPTPIGLLHGFMVTPWVPAKPGLPSKVPNARLLDYLALRASLPPDGAGASLAELFAMAAYNLEQRCGPGTQAIVQQALGDPSRFASIHCCTDNRLHAWEWLQTSNGWFKLDGLDHHAAHDLVGCQDIAWDLAGASVELELAIEQRDTLAHALGTRINRPISPQFVAACEICYIGFQIGLWTMALSRNNASERQRIEQLLGRYQRHRALTALGITPAIHLR